MPIIPAFCIIIVYCLKSKPFLIYLLIFLNIPFYYNSIIKQPYQGTVDTTIRFVNTRNYRELYRAINPRQRKNLSEDSFINTYENFLNQIGARKIESNITSLKVENNKVTGKLEVKYQTRYGELNNESPIEFNKINNQWKLNWSWNYLYHSYDPAYPLKIEIKPNSTSILEVHMIPRLMFDWGKSLTQIQTITTINQKILDERIRSTVPDKYPRWVADINFNNFDKNVKIPGLEYYDYPNLAKLYFINYEGKEIILFK
jgi:hypothetical protein